MTRTRSAPRYRPIRLVWICLALIASWRLAAPGASGSEEVRGAEPGTVPAVEVRLERVIETRADLKRRGILSRLTGRADPALFQRPFGVAWWDDDLMVADPALGRVVGIPKKGPPGLSPDGLFQSPIGIAACPAGLVVSDSTAGRVALLGKNLRLVRWVAEGLRRPTGVTCDGERILVVETASHRILVLAPEAAPAVAATTGGESPAGVEESLLFAAPADEEVRVLAPYRAARILGGRGSMQGEFNYPTTISSGLGAIWVGDTLNFRLQKFHPVTGRFIGSFGRLGDAPGEMPRLKGVAIDSGGRLWITDAYLDQIALFGTDGRFLTALGGRGAEPGRFSFPAGIAAHPDGRVAVADSLNRRVQIFRFGGRA